MLLLLGVLLLLIKEQWYWIYYLTIVLEITCNMLLAKEKGKKDKCSN